MNVFRPLILNAMHDYQFVSTLSWNGMVCRRCGDKLGIMSQTGKMRTHYMGSTEVCPDPTPFIREIKS